MPIISTPQTLNAIQESGFIQDILFNGIPYSTDLNPKRFSESALIYLELFDINRDFISAAKSLGKKIVLYHMGDELGDKDIRAYFDCDLIIRNYYISHILQTPELHQKMIWAPNGYKTGVGPRNRQTLLPSSQRPHLACFLGWLSNTASFNGERSLFFEAIHASSGSFKNRRRAFWRWLKHYRVLSDNYLTFTRIAPQCTPDLYLMGSKGFSAGYNVGLYSAVMENSIFAPCPAGNSPETIRLYDALESGCIPVLLQHEFIDAKDALAEFGNPPITILQSWNEFPSFLQRIKEQFRVNPQKIQEQQEHCITWWTHYKDKIRQKITSRLTDLSQ
jgi:hypothetical protein